MEQDRDSGRKHGSVIHHPDLLMLGDGWGAFPSMGEEQQPKTPEHQPGIIHSPSLPCPVRLRVIHSMHSTGVSQLPWPCWLPFPAQRAHGLPAGQAVGKSVSSSARYDTTVGACKGSSEAVGKYEGQGRLRFV